MVTEDPVLIIAYRRSENISKLIEMLISFNVPKIYISLDNVDESDPGAHLDHLRCLEVINKYSLAYPDKIKTNFHKLKVGCAVGVISACDWFFKSEKFGIVLEDDCFPCYDFFQLVNSAKKFLDQISNIWLICGTQIIVEESKKLGSYVSKYALTWGWATSDTKWQEISHSFSLTVKDYSIRNKLVPENSYWYFGANRAEQGLVDVWDTILLHRMQVLNKKAILPYQNLVTNMGYDDRATHTKGNIDISKNFGKFRAVIGIKEDFEMDNLIKKQAYSISSRYLLTNRVRWLLDLTANKIKRRKAEPLRKRLGRVE